LRQTSVAIGRIYAKHVSHTA